MKGQQKDLRRHGGEGWGVGTKQEGECGAPGRMLGRISQGRQGCPEVGVIGAEVAVLLTQVQMQAKDRA